MITVRIMAMTIIIIVHRHVFYYSCQETGNCCTLYLRTCAVDACCCAVDCR